jgi:hypothetical protein
MDTNVMIGIISIIVAIVIAIAPWIKKKFFTRPELTIELVFDSGLNANLGLSYKNDLSLGYIEGDKAIHVWSLTWKMKLIIRNNSDITAHYPEIFLKNDALYFTKIDSLNKLKSITNTSEIVLNCEYQKYSESTPDERPELGGFPQEFEDLKILLQYKNSAKMRFYTLFDFADKKEHNKFKGIRPKGFKK